MCDASIWICQQACQEGVSCCHMSTQSADYAEALLSRYEELRILKGLRCKMQGRQGTITVLKLFTCSISHEPRSCLQASARRGVSPPICIVVWYWWYEG
jgi:hypothetical protein